MCITNSLFTNDTIKSGHTIIHTIRSGGLCLISCDETVRFFPHDIWDIRHSSMMLTAKCRSLHNNQHRYIGITHSTQCSLLPLYQNIFPTCSNIHDMLSDAPALFLLNQVFRFYIFRCSGNNASKTGIPLVHLTGLVHLLPHSQ